MNPNQPLDTNEIFAEIFKRLRNLESRNVLQSTEILEIVDNGTPNTTTRTIARFGDLGDGSTGIELFTANGNRSFGANSQYGLRSPWLSTGWWKDNDPVTVTSGTFVATWTTLTELMWSDELLFRVRIVSDAATTGEVRLFNVGGSQMGSTLSIDASHDTTHEYRFTHGFALGGGPIIMQIQARRLTGTGNIYVYPPYDLFYGHDMATVAGGWV